MTLEYMLKKTFLTLMCCPNVATPAGIRMSAPENVLTLLYCPNAATPVGNVVIRKKNAFFDLLIKS
jgi:hypothetical protein